MTQKEVEFIGKLNSVGAAVLISNEGIILTFIGSNNQADIEISMDIKQFNDIRATLKKEIPKNVYQIEDLEDKQVEEYIENLLKIIKNETIS